MKPAATNSTAEGGCHLRPRLVSDAASAHHRVIQISSEEGYQELRRIYGPGWPCREDPVNCYEEAIPHPALDSLNRHVRWQELSKHFPSVNGASASVDHFGAPSKVASRDSPKRKFPMFWKHGKKPVEHGVADQPVLISHPMPLRRRTQSDAPNPRRK